MEQRQFGNSGLYASAIERILADEGIPAYRDVELVT